LSGSRLRGIADSRERERETRLCIARVPRAGDCSPRARQTYERVSPRSIRARGKVGRARDRISRGLDLREDSQRRVVLERVSNGERSAITGGACTLALSKSALAESGNMKRSNEN